MIPKDILSSFNSRFPSGITTIDSHTAGEYTRLIVDGLPSVQGVSMADKREYFINNLDRFRLLLTTEPRGNRDVVAAALTEPVTPGAAFGLIYMDARRYPYLCGHATIGAVSTLLETGMISARPDRYGMVQVVVDTPSGPMPTLARIKNNRVLSVSFTSVPCFVHSENINLELAQGPVVIDVVNAGGFFAMVDMDQPMLKTRPLSHPQLIIDLGMAVTAKACLNLKVSHPQRPEVSTIDVTEFYRHSGPHEGESFVVYGESHLDRSPCGTGTSAKMALLYHKGLISENDTYRNKGPLGTSFLARIADSTHVGPYPAVRVEITGTAHMTGMHWFVLDQQDPFPQGFLL